jgi:ATP-dependent Clp protease ATP-binding subunit ClpB
MRVLQEKLDQARQALELAQRKGDLGKAGEYMYGVIPGLEKELEAARANRDHGWLHQEVTQDDVAAVVARWTGIPVDRMVQAEQDRVLNMEQVLRRRVVGQDEAVQAVCHVVRRARAGLQDPGRPLGSFLFMGSTGVGKTELAKAVAEFLFDDEKALLRLDMSEYMERHAVARLTGAPPGYVGYEEGGMLTEAVRRRPWQVILFDEIEKAHSDVFNILLQVLDGGRLTDSHGRTVDFRNTLVILTSNLGGEILARQISGDIPEPVRESVMEIVRRTFRPELINRLDEILFFRPLSAEQIQEVAGIQVRRFCDMLREQRHIELHVDDQACLWLARQGYDPVFGARPLGRVIQTHLKNPLANLILSGGVRDGDTLVVVCEGNGLAIRKTQ